MKILYVHFKQSKTEAQVKLIADKVRLLKEVSGNYFAYDDIFVCALVVEGVANPGDSGDLHER